MAALPHDVLTLAAPVIEVKGAQNGPGYAEILTPAALALVGELHRRFEPTRRELLAARRARQVEFDAGALPDFAPETQAIRAGDWRVAPLPAALADRRVEITGPVERKMIINALNSSAKVFMADFEDSNTPTWSNLIEGQINLRDAVDGTISYTAPDGKRYALKERRATLMVRPRGWHLVERHVTVDGAPVSGALFDFALFAFHNAAALAARGLGPFWYLPKLQAHGEAALWNAAMEFVEAKLGL